MEQVQENKKTGALSGMITVLLIMYILTGVLLFFLSFLLYKFEIKESVVTVGIILTYVISGLTGGFLAGKKMKVKKFAWGFLVGVLYFAILIAVSVIMKNNVLENMEHAVLTVIMCVASSTVGGMVS
jgi:putative membrane protein, TIGR04086 family/integral membrane protein, TIGR04097 family